MGLFLAPPMQANAAPVEEVKNFFRPYISKILGQEITLKYFGPKRIHLNLPPIPTIYSDATSTKIYHHSIRNVSINKQKASRYHVSYLKEIMQVTRKVRASEQQLSTWYNVLSQGGTREGVYRAIVLGDLYTSLEKDERPIGDPLIEFSISYFQKYLHKNITASQIERSNFFSLKRVLCEKTLELIDSFPTNNDHLERWYALLSAELAKRPELTFNSKIRKSSDPLLHYNWAKSVPTQHIKSETLIKMHLFMNKLNQ